MTQLTPASASMSATEELQQMQADMVKGQIDSAMEGKGGGTTPQSANASGSNAPRNGTSGDSTDVEKPAGRNDVLAFLEKNADALPGGAEAFREIQRSVSSQGTANKELMDRLDKLEEGPKEPPKPDPQDVRRKQLLARMPRGQRETFEAMIDEMGLVSRDELDQEAAVERSTEQTRTSITEGIEKWGDHFGRMEGDNFVWNEDDHEEMRELYRSLKDPNEGITPNQLYILQNHEALLEQAAQGGASGAEGTDRINRLHRANGMQRKSSNAPATEPPLKEEGDSLEEITAKAVRRNWKKVFG